jgi:ABC-type Mn2+/Zn2+ transport system permease subunit
MTTNIKLKLIGLLTTVALLALPAAEASAHTHWC